MTEYILIPLGFFLALILSLYMIPMVRKAAIKWGVMDKPDGELKTQTTPVPYLGGIGVYLAFLLSLSLIYDFSPEVLGLLLGGTIMLLIGLVDDFGVLLPYQKFAGQFLATFVLVKAGIYIEVEFLPIWVSIPLTFFWMLAIINAVNIIDIADGLSSGVAFSVCVILLIVSLINGNITIAIITAALAGSLLGFLRFNFHPATIYLGDAGSLFIGLMLGALAMIGDYSDQNFMAYINPVIILGIPIFDTVFVMIIRSFKGISIFLGSPDHFAIRLQRKGMSVKSVAILSICTSLILGGIAILNMFLDPTGSFIIIGALSVFSLGFMFYLSRIKV